MALAQKIPDEAPVGAAQETVATPTPVADVFELAPTGEPGEEEPGKGEAGKEEAPPAPDPLELPAKQHPWARFLPGAWREVQTVTETFDEAGEVVSRNVTTQKEVLEAVAEEKYVLKVQATVDLGGKRIVGDWKDRVLYLLTDAAGVVAGSRGVEDRSLLLAGRAVMCRVYEIRYREGARNLIDRVHYDSEHFPFVLRRETFAEYDPQESAAATEQLMEVSAQEVPYQVGTQLLDCSCLRTFRHLAKGDTLRLAFSNASVPGGEVAVWSTDFDTEGQRVRWSITRLLDYGTDYDGLDSVIEHGNDHGESSSEDVETP